MNQLQDKSQSGRLHSTELNQVASRILSVQSFIKACTGEVGLYVMGASLVGIVMATVIILVTEWLLRSL